MQEFWKIILITSIIISKAYKPALLVRDTALSAIVETFYIATVMSLIQLAITSLLSLVLILVNVQQALESGKSSTAKITTQ